MINRIESCNYNNNNNNNCSVYTRGGIHSDRRLI